MFSNQMQSLGGASTSSGPSMYKTITSKISWSVVMYVILAILLILIVIYFYKQYTSSNTSDSKDYKINRENMHNKGSGNAELILFYVDWCPHCKTAKPEWDSLKTDYEGKTINGYKVIFTEHNCTNESPEVEELMNKYKIEGYPTVKLIKDNQVIEFDAKPTKATLEQFINTVL
jgi:thiol-disulfide isomerase/thioredoxin